MNQPSGNNLLAEVTQEVNQIVINDDTESASEFLAAIAERLQPKRGGAPEERAAWQRLQQQLHWVLFSQQPWDRCVALFRSGLGTVVEFLPGIDVTAKLTTKLLLEDPAVRDQYRKKISQALLENTEPLTEPVRLPTASSDGTISSWLQQYTTAVGSGPADSLEYQQWLAQDPLVSTLKPAERARLEWLTQLYEELKHSSQSIEGLEEGIYTTDERGRPAYYHRGQFRLVDPDGSIRRRINAMQPASGTPAAPVLSSDVPPATLVPTPALPVRPPFKAPAVPAAIRPQKVSVGPPAGRTTGTGQWTNERIVARYQGDPAKATAVAQRGTALQQSTRGQAAAVRDALYAAVTAAQPDEVEIVAALQLLAAADALDDVLRDDSRFTQLVSQTLTRQGNTNRLSDLQLYPTAPQFVQFFLELVLQTKVGLAEDQAARWGLQLANALKRAGNDKYSQIAYFDITDGQFHWRR